MLPALTPEAPRTQPGPLKFAAPEMVDDFALLPQQLRDKVTGLASWLHAKGWEAPFITCIRRTADDSERIYTPYAENLVRSLKMGLSLADKERVLAAELAKMTPEERKAWAREKFSWHNVLCAVDIRNRVYSRGQRMAIMNHLRYGTNTTDWEVLEHDVGRGDHIHLARRDVDRRKAWRP